MVEVKDFMALFLLAIFHTPIFSMEAQTLEGSSLSDNILNAESKVQCGGVFNGTNSGFSHKPFEQVLEHERCTWVIGVPDAVGYLIDIQFLGSPTNLAGSGQELIFTAIAHANPPKLLTYKPTSTGHMRVDDCHIIIVTFHSSVKNTSLSTGFSIRYESFNVGNLTKISPLTTHHILEVPTFDFIYPRTEGTNYQIYELAAFIFPTIDNIYAGRSKHLLYHEYRIEGNCADALHVYTYSANTPTETGKWENSGRLCAGGTGTTRYIPHDDMVLIIFTSDHRYQYDGIGSFTIMGC